MRHDGVEPGAQQGSALLGGLPPPGRPGGFSGGHGIAGVGGGEVGHLGQHLAGGGVGDGEAQLGIAPLTANQGLVDQDFRRERHGGSMCVDYLVYRVCII